MVYIHRIYTYSRLVTARLWSEEYFLNSHLIFSSYYSCNIDQKNYSCSCNVRERERLIPCIYSCVRRAVHLAPWPCYNSAETAANTEPRALSRLDETQNVMTEQSRSLFVHLENCFLIYSTVHDFEINLNRLSFTVKTLDGTVYV